MGVGGWAVEKGQSGGCEEVVLATFVLGRKGEDLSSILRKRVVIPLGPWGSGIDAGFPFAKKPLNLITANCLNFGK